MKTTFYQPEARGRLPAGILDELSAQFPHTVTDTEWYSDPSKSHLNIDMLKIIEPVTQFILDNRVNFGINAPEKISYFVDTRPVMPGTSQRSLGWHIDPKKVYGLTAADTLPTEFLVARHGLDRKTKRKLIWQTESHGKVELTDEELKAKGLEVYHGDPGELIHIGAEIHRSPINTSTEVVERTWFRAFVIPSRVR